MTKRLEKNRRSSILNRLNPFQKFEEGNMHFIDESKICDRVSLYIEPHRFGYKSHSLIFEKNPQTGEVDLTYCSQKLFGKDIRQIFKNCTHFGITDHKSKEFFLELTAESCEYSFLLHCSFKLSFDHEAMLDSVNKLLETAQDENREARGLLPLVYPLCEILYRERKDNGDDIPLDIRNNLRNNPSITYYSECENNFDMHAKSDHFCTLSIAEDEKENEVVATAVHSEIKLFAAAVHSLAHHPHHNL